LRRKVATGRSPGGSTPPQAGRHPSVDRRRLAVTICDVSAYYVSLVAINPKREELRTPPVRVLVDTGSEMSWMPAEALTTIGLTPRRQRVFRMADGRTIQRQVGYGILSAEGFETIDEIVFAQPGDCHLLGVRTIEGFGVVIDAVAHKMVATATLAASGLPLR
jgi:predicted aspartyl protease